MQISAVLITGGYAGKGLSTVELYHPASGTTCIIPNLPDARTMHTQDNNLLCGGYFTRDTCLQWNSVNATWEELLTLDVKRFAHVSWTPDPDIGTYLMGGGDKESRGTTTLITPDGGQEQGFSL